jgi:hypothetical protein
MLSKKIIIPVAIVSVGTAAVFGTGLVMAQSNNPISGLSQAIAQKFNLDQTAVQQVVDQYRGQHKTQVIQNMQQREDQSLSALVTQGKITADQKTAIENELSSLKDKYLNTLQNATPAQRRQAMINFRNDLLSWLKSQNIDPSLIKPRFGMMGKGRFGGWPKGSPSPTPAT